LRDGLKEGNIEGTKQGMTEECIAGISEWLFEGNNNISNI
jgi:hypothetical protein